MNRSQYGKRKKAWASPSTESRELSEAEILQIRTSLADESKHFHILSDLKKKRYGHPDRSYTGAPYATLQKSPGKLARLKITTPLPSLGVEPAFLVQRPPAEVVRQRLNSYPSLEPLHQSPLPATLEEGETYYLNSSSLQGRRGLPALSVEAPGSNSTYISSVRSSEWDDGEHSVSSLNLDSKPSSKASKQSHFNFFESKVDTGAENDQAMSQLPNAVFYSDILRTLPNEQVDLSIWNAYDPDVRRLVFEMSRPELNGLSVKELKLAKCNKLSLRGLGLVLDLGSLTKVHVFRILDAKYLMMSVFPSCSDSCRGMFYLKLSNLILSHLSLALATVGLVWHRGGERFLRR